MRRALSLTLAPGLISALAVACTPPGDIVVGNVVVDGPPPAPPAPPPPPPSDEGCTLIETVRAVATDALLRAEVRTLNEWGDELHTRYDDDGDGQDDRQTFRSFDANGRITVIEEDLDLDGAPDRVERFSYELGQLVEHRVDTDGDGFPDELSLWAFAEDGQLTMHTVDRDGDFLPDFEDRRVYDAAGRLTEQTVDVDGDGVIDQRYSRAWDAAGLVLAVDDLDDDGTPDRSLERLSAPPGRVELEQVDEDDDGVPEVRTEHRYDPRDRLRVSVRQAPGGIERRFFRWGPGGRLGRIELVLETGAAEVRGAHSFVYDAAGRLTSERLDREGDGVLELAHSRELDEGGELVARDLVERGPAGVVAQISLRAGPGGRTERSAFDLDDDGALDVRGLLEWDPDEVEPRLELHDDDADGGWDRRVVRVVRCEAQPQ